jgi:hypothetical protein
MNLNLKMKMNRVMMMMSFTSNLKSDNLRHFVLLNCSITMASILPPPVHHPTLIPQHNLIIEHPNGSDGWLPAEAFPKPDTGTPTTVRRSTTTGTSPLSKRKSAFRGPSTSRNLSVTEARQTAPFVDATGTTAPVPAVTSDEELQNRAVSADNVLSPKQRSRIAKSEGQ